MILQSSAFVLALLPWIVHASRPFGVTSDPELFAEQTFDFVVIGAGTAGLTLAARLSEDPSLQIGVIEAGNLYIDEPLIDTPELSGQALFNSKFDWSFMTVPQSHANNRSMPLNRGKMVGGSSGLNIMAWQRASKEDYDLWQELESGQGWDWDGLFPFFRKTENVTVGPLNVFPGINVPAGFDNAVEGRSGPLQVSYNNFYTALIAPFVNAVRAMGGHVNPNPDNGDTSGLFNSAHSVDPRTGNRSYATNAYFLPNINRKNLLVLTGAQATKILLRKPTTSSLEVAATGVQYSASGKLFQAAIRKEVILSAGAIQTPQILELSGIGSRQLLKSLGIPVIVDLPTVGENLQDHLGVSSVFRLRDPSTVTIDLLTLNATFAKEQEQLYKTQHTGALTFTSPTLSFNTLQNFVNNTELSGMIHRLEGEIAAAKLDPFQQRQAEIQLRVIKEGRLAQIEFIFVPSTAFGPPPPGANQYTIFTFAPRPFSRGNVHINTTDPLAPPVLNPNYLSYNFDLEVLRTALQLARQFTTTPPLRNLTSEMVSPGPDVDSNEDFDNFVREESTTEWHPIGTTALAPKECGGVVDPQLLVYGTQNVRVVDASIIPLHISAHLQVTVYAIAEKAATLILAK